MTDLIRHVIGLHLCQNRSSYDTS